MHGMVRRSVAHEAHNILVQFHASPVGGHFGSTHIVAKVEIVYYWPSLFKDSHAYVTASKQRWITDNIERNHEMLMQPIMEVKIFDIQGIDFIGHFPISNSFLYILIVVDVSKWVEAIPTRTNDSKVVCSFVKKNIFCRFGTP